MTDAVIVDAIRTPGGKRNGKLKDWHPVDLAAHVLKALQERSACLLANHGQICFGPNLDKALS